MSQQYDDATKQFLTATWKPKQPEQPITVGDARTSMMITKGLLEKSPKVLGGLVVMKGLQALTHPPKFEIGDGIKTAAQNDVAFDIISIYSDLNDSYGRGWWDWEPETIRTVLHDDHSIDLGDNGVDIIGALQVILNTNYAHELWNVFENVCAAMNGEDVNFGVIQPQELTSIAYTLKVLNRIRPKTDLEPEVDAYIAACAKNAGVVYLPEDLFGKGPQEKLDDLNNDLSLKERVALIRDKKAEVDSEAEEIQIKRLQEIEEYVNGRYV